MKPLRNLRQDFKLSMEQVKQANAMLPQIIGVECVKVIKSNFQKQGYTSAGQWPKRKESTNKLYDYNRNASYRTPKLGKVSKYKNPYKGSVVRSGNPILLQTRNLRDSVSYSISGSIVTIGVFRRTIVINGETHDTMNYAKVHNEGLSFMAWGKHAAKMPKRQFMPRPSDPPTQAMRDAIKKKYYEKLNAIMNPWKL